MNTVLRTASKMRYPTCGDYYEENGQSVIEVFEQGNEDYNFLIKLHELIEQYLTQKRGIANEQIDQFDFEYEKNREEGDLTSEPGDHKDCPYKKEHRFATIMEQLMAYELGVDWQEYEKNIKVYEPTT